MKGIAEVINAITGLAWPLIAGLLLWRLFPSIRKIVESRGITVKVGQVELTIQEISEKLLATTADIQDKLASVTVATGGATNARDLDQPRVVRRLLWVDDVPSNNTYEAAQLETLGVSVSNAISTKDALTMLLESPAPFDAVISDMGRVEGTGFNEDAGLDLIRQARGRGFDVPIFVYSSGRGVTRRREVLDVGGGGITASPTELFALLRSVGSFPSASIG